MCACIPVPDHQTQSDRDLLQRAEARELLRHRAAGGSDDYIKKRALIVDKLYGKGSRELIRKIMKTMKETGE
jgi:hypothetical protein